MHTSSFMLFLRIISSLLQSFNNRGHESKRKPYSLLTIIELDETASGII